MSGLQCLVRIPLGFLLYLHSIHPTTRVLLAYTKTSFKVTSKVGHLNDAQPDHIQQTVGILDNRNTLVAWGVIHPRPSELQQY